MKEALDKLIKKSFDLYNLKKLKESEDD